MKILLPNNKIFSIGLILTLLIGLNSCYKTESTTAIISVLDSSSEDPISGATVELLYIAGHPDSTEIHATNTTSNSGDAFFDFTDKYKAGQAGFAVLDIKVNGTYKGIIEIKEMVENKETIYL
tara:strand:- start:142 stop:510 length:369 start_codon:yes stop_codon:yes gene_type:complete